VDSERQNNIVQILADQSIHVMQLAEAKTKLAQLTTELQAKDEQLRQLKNENFELHTKLNSSNSDRLSWLQQQRIRE
jgi:cell shape-determining protein MreC